MTHPAIPILQAARARIAKGWYQGGFWDNYPAPATEDSRVCVLGAIRLCAEGTHRTVTEDAIYDTLADMTESSLVTWNDRPERTQQEVLDLFDKTIERLREADQASVAD